MSLISGLLKDAMIGLGSAALVGAILYSQNYLRDRYLERKFPVGGSYISMFVDEVDGEREETRAPTRLEQSGRDIEGYTKIPGADREWKLDGTISSNGYINGVYRAQDPHDRGVGNFFLYIDHERNMEGMWSGFDEVNDKINSGRYIFTPTYDNFEIQSLKRKQIPAIINLADSMLGKNYVSSDILEDSLSGESPYFTKVAVSRSQDDPDRLDRVLDRIFGLDAQLGWRTLSSDSDDVGEVIGFCLGAVMDKEQIRSYLLVDEDEFTEGLKHADKIGVIRTIVIKDGYQGRGVGTDLIGASIDELAAEDCGVLLSVGWLEDSEVNIGGIMERFGFDQIGMFDEYWHDDSLEHGYRCQSCGEPPCECSAVIFTKYQ